MKNQSNSSLDLAASLHLSVLIESVWKWEAARPSFKGKRKLLIFESFYFNFMVFFEFK